MSRSYLVNLLVEVHVEDREDWLSLEDLLDDNYDWDVSCSDWDASPYVISAEVESYVEVIDGVADHG